MVYCRIASSRVGSADVFTSGRRGHLQQCAEFLPLDQPAGGILIRGIRPSSCGEAVRTIDTHRARRG